MTPSGRPSKYNEETLDLFCAALAEGLWIKDACVVAGIGVQTLNDWRKRHPGLEPRIYRARELARREALRKRGILEPPPSNFTPRQLNWAGQPMKESESYGGR